MQKISTLDELAAIYGDPAPASLTKVAPVLTPLYQRWISQAKFLILSTVGPEGTDASPRGDDGPVVAITDASTLLIPDWRGNNRLDSLRNIVRDPRVSLMFLIVGCNNVVRVNGTAIVTADPAATSAFEKRGMRPKTVISVTVGEAYFQCAKAVMRSGLWAAQTKAPDLPTAGQFIKEMDGGFDAKTYDTAYPIRAQETMWE